MPYTVKKNKFKYRNPTTGNYEGVDVVAEQDFADYRDELEAVGDAQETRVTNAGTAQVNAIDAAGTAAVANFPATADACDTLAADFAATFVPNQAYAAGAYCTYQYKLYQAKAAIAENADSSFVASHWNLITVTETLNDQVGDLKTHINKFDYSPVLTSNDVVSDYYVRGDDSADQGQVVSSNLYVCTDFIPIPASSNGLSIMFNCFFGSIIGYAFYSSMSVNSCIGGGAEGGWAQKTVKTMIPHGTRYFRTTLQASNYSNPSDFGISYQIPIADIKNEADATAKEVAEIGYVGEETNGSWVQGTIDSVSGEIFNNRDDRIADRTFYKVSDIASVSVGSGFNVLYGSYSSDTIDGFSSVSSWYSTFDSFNGTYVRFAIKKTSGADILPTEDTGFVLKYKSQPVNAVVKELASQMKEDADVNFAIGSKNQIARLGWNVYSSNTPPEQSNASYALAYENGCRIMLCDVRVTVDGEFILWHDSTLNNTVRHADGTSLTAEELALEIEDLTIAQLNEYDFGIYKGAYYAGMKIPTLKKFIEWCSLMNCWAMLEIKVRLTETQCAEIASMCKTFGMGERTIVDEYLTNLVDYQGETGTGPYWIEYFPTATICIIGGTTISTSLATAEAFKNAGMKTLLTLSTSAQLDGIQTDGHLDYSKVSAITDTGTNLTYTEIQSESALSDFYDGGYLSVFQYIASGYVNINKWIRNKMLR